jgi:hypothetical protein
MKVERKRVERLRRRLPVPKKENSFLPEEKKPVKKSNAKGNKKKK